MGEDFRPDCAVAWKSPTHHVEIHSCAQLADHDGLHQCACGAKNMVPDGQGTLL